MKTPQSATRVVFALGIILFLSILIGSMVMAFGRGEEDSPTEQDQTISEADMTFQLTSDAFANGQSIPAKYSCIGRNISPALTWNEPSAGTQSFALIMEDPDAPMGTWVHWVLSNIPVDRRSLEEAVPVTGKNVANTNGIFVGKNSSGNIGYDGPCPPSGTHRYYFRLYALGIQIGLLPGASKEDVLREMNGHILAQAELMGTFSK
jgi:Raf kinase inhibitor-like YbhB/YbcL family protein